MYITWIEASKSENLISLMEMMNIHIILNAFIELRCRGYSMGEGSRSSDASFMTLGSQMGGWLFARLQDKIQRGLYLCNLQDFTSDHRACWAESYNHLSGEHCSLLARRPHTDIIVTIFNNCVSKLLDKLSQLVGCFWNSMDVWW